MIRRLTLLLAALTLTACSNPQPHQPPTGTGSPTASVATTAPVETRPADNACYRLSYTEAVAPTTDIAPVKCRKPHTALTFHVGSILTVVDGHLLAVDSKQVQDDIAHQCTRRLARFLGGSKDDLALSMFRAVWFSPTVEQSDDGQNWFRCDVIALAREDQLAKLPRHPTLAAGLDGWGSCATAEPGSSGFERVLCSEHHTWRAIAVVRHRGTSYPGADDLTSDRSSCEDPARAAAEDPLSVKFSYLAPTRAQWNAGQHYGTCWVPTT